VYFDYQSLKPNFMHLNYHYKVEFKRDGKSYYSDIKANNKQEAEYHVIDTYPHSHVEIIRTTNYDREEFIHQLAKFLLEEEKYSSNPIIRECAISALFAAFSTQTFHLIDNHPTENLTKIADRVFHHLTHR
jgi:hypothetical protein